jgi:anti-anti-sigma factor
VTGELDIAAAPALGDAWAGAVTRHPAQQVVVDLSGVTFMDCCGLSALLRARSRLDDRLWLRAPSSAVTWVLTLTDMTDAFALLDELPGVEASAVLEVPLLPGVPYSSALPRQTHPPLNVQP